MFEKAYNTANEHLFFRPMITKTIAMEDRKILFSGSMEKKADEPGVLKPEVQHLGCFVGGMVALGSKLLGRPDMMETAAQLTDGCVWAYEQTATGIMPERFEAIPCADRDNCHWNQTLWDEVTNPNNPTEAVNSVAVKNI